MNRLTTDRLLYNFRQNAGLPVGDAKPFGGWETPADGQARHRTARPFHRPLPLGQRATLRLHRRQGRQNQGRRDGGRTGEVPTKTGGGYLSAFPTELFDRLDNLSGKPRPTDRSAPGLPWAPFYTIHKIMAGMLDMYQLAGNKQALQVLEGMAGWADQWTASKTEAAHAGDPQHRIRRHGGDAVQPRRR